MPSERNLLPEQLASLGYQAVPHPRTPAITSPLVTVPAGPFLMGSDSRHDPDAREHEEPQHTVELRAYQIARYPVTVAEYALAARAGVVRLPGDFLNGPAAHGALPLHAARWP